MAKRPPLSKGEMEVARTIWSLGEASVGLIYEEMANTRKIDYSTVQTYVRRLEAKGYLKIKRVGRNKLYSAKVQPGTVIRQAVDELKNQLFDGQLMPMVKHLIDGHEFSEAEIQELRDILNEAEDPDEQA